jgi:hypothetical protein
VRGAANDVRIVKPDAFIWREGRIGQGMRDVALPEMSFHHSDRPAIVAPFEWSVA